MKTIVEGFEKKRLCHSQNGGGTEDRLSTLPVRLIINILSHLPLATAAATSAVSTRFRGLWTAITSVRTSYATAKLNTSAFTHILRQLTSPKLHLLDVTREWYGDNSKEYQDCVLDLIFSRDVEVLHYRDEWSKCWLPAKIFQCNSLVELELGKFSNVLIEDDGGEILDKFDLPNLKKLDIQVNNNLCKKICFRALFRSCLLLERLCMWFDLRYDNDVVVEISCPNLKYLEIIMVVPSKSEFIIDAPKLCDIIIHDFISLYTFTTVSPLVVADVLVDVDGYLEYIFRLNGDVKMVDDMIFSIIRGISTSTSVLKGLTLTGIAGGEDDVELIGSILRRAPLLENVVVEIRKMRKIFRPLKKSEFLAELLKLERSSAKCQIHVINSTDE